ncbi:AarF/UbiB family protein [Sphingobacterium sp. SRCM116780]|uniref:ABC1 kinase family protein n=1 Tax=Sphingobacterium sp. SRCM116780 TaxID=2907623 RepID=UPI001F434BF8|nr:lipopolysaccharide core heptose(II) kinase RfaY [Sphingobacterium sp. SRCM116780]UIR54586.1 AarF/UbiB family protein [Sphingobacterium sp. SRCM116780]
MHNPAKKLQRSSHIISVLAKYGFRDILTRLPWNTKQTHLEKGVDVANISVYRRIRMTLEELGPAFVKLGQSASTREGLLPKELVDELKYLEDRVDPFSIDIKSYLEEELNIHFEEHFSHIDSEPFAAASISQVYKANLLDGKAVVVKVRRPHVDEVLKTDLALMRDIARILVGYSEPLQNLNLPLIVDSFAATLEEEISLLNERYNIERFAKNFKGNSKIVVPKVYPAVSSDRVLTMEYMDGIKVTDKAKLKELGLDLEEIVDNGINLYLEQVIVHGFFHGDPHPGNLIVMRNGKLAFIDFGNMGKLLSIDRQNLEGFIQAAVSSNAPHLADIIEDVAIVSHIPDRAKFERSLYEIFDLIDNVSLGDISLESLFNKLWRIIGNNRLYFPEYIYQLIRGISLMEGIGRHLNPDLNIMKSIKPFANRIMRERLDPAYLFKKGKNKAFAFARDIEKLPDDLRSVFRQIKTGNFTLNHHLISAKSFNQILKKGVNRIVIGIMMLSLNMLAGMVIIAHVEPKFWGIPIWAWLFLGSSFALAIYLFISMLRARNKD